MHAERLIRLLTSLHACGPFRIVWRWARMMAEGAYVLIVRGFVWAILSPQMHDGLNRIPALCRTVCAQTVALIPDRLSHALTLCFVLRHTQFYRGTRPASLGRRA